MSANPSTTHLTLAQLKAQRLKPARGQRPSSSYWQGFGWVSTYDMTKAIPMRPYRAPTAAQLAALAAGRALLGTAPCDQCGERFDKGELSKRGVCLDCLEANRLNRARATAKEWLESEALVVDTETTGLDGKDQVIELAVLTMDGTVLLDTLIQPSVPCSSGAREAHGISDEMLANAPTWQQVAPLVRAAISGRSIVAHNAEFDWRLLRQTAQAHGVDLGLDDVDQWCCTLDLLTDVNRGRWPNLRRALELARAEPPQGAQHRAAADAEACRRVVVALADQS